jgi:hypothetical protein
MRSGGRGFCFMIAAVMQTDSYRLALLSAPGALYHWIQAFA